MELFAQRCSASVFSAHSHSFSWRSFQAHSKTEKYFLFFFANFYSFQFVLFSSKVTTDKGTASGNQSSS